METRSTTNAEGTTGVSPIRRSAIPRLAVRAILPILFCALPVWFWYFRLQPWYYLEALDWSIKTRGPNPEAGLSRSVDNVVSLGQRALPQVIDRIAKNSIYSKSAALLPSVLKRIGKPGHDALIEAIDHEADRWRQVSMIAALIQAYDDFSRVNLWIDDLRQHPSNMPNALNREFQAHFGTEVPDLRKGFDRLKPEFLKWYKKRTMPNGPFPALKKW